MNNRSKPSPEEYNAELFKGSMQMGALLDQHVRSLREEAVGAAAEVSVRPSGDRTVSVSAKDVARMATSTSHMAANRSA